MTRPHLACRDADDDHESEVERAYCTVVEGFVRPVRADVRTERYGLPPNATGALPRGGVAGVGRVGWRSDYLDGTPVVVTAALTGGIRGKEATPELPETPEEIAAAACEAAGASVLHLHARRDDGERAFSTQRFQAVTDAVRAATDGAILQHSTGGTAAPDALRAEPLRTDSAPEMASLDTGPLNRGRWRRRRRRATFSGWRT